MNFYKLKEAATEIAAALYPANTDSESEGPRQDAERSYLAALQNAVCENEVVYRDPGSRLPVRRTGLEASLAAHSCIVSQDDLNAWLQEKGVGIQITNSRPAHSAGGASIAPGADTDVDSAAVQAKPTSAQLAKAIGPYLTNEEGEEWLKKVLGDIRNRPRLEKYREMVQSGNRRIAVWEAGAVVLYLIESDDLKWESAKDALTKHYPQHLSVLDGLGSREAPPVASWIPDGIG